MLKNDNFYPQCSDCETNLFVQRATTMNRTFRCNRCMGEWVDTEFSYLFSHYDRSHVRQYILYYIGGYSRKEIARGSPLTTEQVKHSIRNMQRRMKVEFNEVPRPDGQADPSVVTLTKPITP